MLTSLGKSLSWLMHTTPHARGISCVFSYRHVRCAAGWMYAVLQHLQISNHHSYARATFKPPPANFGDWGAEFTRRHALSKKNQQKTYIKVVSSRMSSDLQKMCWVHLGGSRRGTGSSWQTRMASACCPMCQVGCGMNQGQGHAIEGLTDLQRLFSQAISF